MPVKPKITRARFVISALSSGQMVRLGSIAAASIKDRLSRGENVSDAPAKPLTVGYARRKSKRAPPALRNWKFTGRTLRSMQVLSANENRARIGFSDPIANMRAVVQNRRERQFGLSETNWDAIKGELRQMKPVGTKAI